VGVRLPQYALTPNQTGMDLLDFFLRSREAHHALQQARARLYRVAYSWCHNNALADDLVQETLTKALRKSAQLRDPKARDAWLFTILANCYRDHFRKLRDMDDVDEIEISHETTPETESSSAEIVGLVRAAIARLPDAQRQVVTLVDLEGFSYVEVSQILEVPIGTVMSRLCRARSAMRTILLPDLQQHPAMNANINIRRVK
jgi:RNA polymerase sigma-70 factor, ECF subfamily